MSEPDIDDRLYYPATQRNRDPILKVLRETLPKSGQVLEISSGSGEHGVYFADALPEIQWIPSDPDPECLASIESWRAAHKLPNLSAPLSLDVRDTPWPIKRVDAVVNINMIHIAPWTACLALLRGCAALLDSGGVLYMYGPYRVGGTHTSESNRQFDRGLRERDPSWGVRDLEDVIEQAHLAGFEHQETIPMPANNLSVIYRRTLSDH